MYTNKLSLVLSLSAVVGSTTSEVVIKISDRITADHYSLGLRTCTSLGLQAEKIRTIRTAEVIEKATSFYAYKPFLNSKNSAFSNRDG